MSVRMFQTTDNGLSEWAPWVHAGDQIWYLDDDGEWSKTRELAKSAGWSFSGRKDDSGKWTGKRKWYTIDRDKAAKLAEFAVSVEIRDELIKKKEHLEKSLVGSRAASTNRVFPHPENLDYFPFQKAGIEYMLDRENTLLCDEMGLGKTIQAIGLVNADPSIKTVLCIVPATLKLNWRNEWRRWLTRDMGKIGIADTKTVPLPEHGYNIVITNYETVGKINRKLANIGWDLLVVDEAHYLKNTKTLRYLSIMGGEYKEKRMDRIPARRRVFATGTPIVNCPAELWPLISAVDPEQWNQRTYWFFHKRYCTPPESPVLMGDLSFKPIGKVKIGDAVIGWAKHNDAYRGRTRLVESKVIDKAEYETDIIKITMKSGRTIRCTTDHLWQSGRSKQVFGSEYKWVKAEIGRKLVHVFDVLCKLSGDKRDAANWLGGIYDGEGTWPRISQCKNHNPEIYERIGKYLDILDFDYSEDKGLNNSGYLVKGAKQAAINFVSWCNPAKRGWIKRRTLLGRYGTAEEIVKIEPDGYGKVIGLKTETGNYVVWGYASKNCNVQNNGYGMDYKGAAKDERLEELQNKLRERCMIRRLKNDVLTELPPKMRQVIELEVDEDDPAIIDVRAMEEDFEIKTHEDREKLAAEAELAKASDDDAAYKAAIEALGENVKVGFAEMSRLYAATAMAKLPYVIEYLKEQLEVVDKMVVFGYHKEPLDKIAGTWPLESVTIHGDIKLEDRQAAVERFQTDPNCRIALVTIKAGGVGITLTAASHVYMIEEWWVPGDIQQAEDRLHRIGQVDSVNVYHLCLSNSLDTNMANRCIAKQKVIDHALDKIEERAPEIVTRDNAATRNTTRAQITEQAQKLDPVKIPLIHSCLKTLQSYDPDRAQFQNMAGFNSIDGRIGHELAMVERLSAKQAVLGMKIIKKYRRQLPGGVYERIFDGSGEAISTGANAPGSAKEEW